MSLIKSKLLTYPLVVAGVTFSDSNSAPVLKFFKIRIRVQARNVFKYSNPTPVQTPASIIDPTVIYPCFHLRNYHADSCCC